MSSEMFEKGISKRRKVLGDEYVDKALATADEFGADLQKLITEYAWGEVWNKESLTDKERSMINLGMIAALNRPHELKLHIKGALNNGLTKDQIRDIFLQVTVYCGAPAGIDSMRLAREVFAEIDKTN
tara:strand:- start:331 stop:714 length:384 start_codon:yes stop_codon:yes gene_type:complete